MQLKRNKFSFAIITRHWNPSNFIMLYREIQEAVRNRINESTIEEFCNVLLQYFHKGQLKLWGNNKGRIFVRKCLYICLFKDIKSKSNNELSKDIRQWLKLPGPTIGHNNQCIRKCLHDAFLPSIKYGDLQE